MCLKCRFLYFNFQVFEVRLRACHLGIGGYGKCFLLAQRFNFDQMICFDVGFFFFGGGGGGFLYSSTCTYVFFSCKVL